MQHELLCNLFFLTTLLSKVYSNPWGRCYANDLVIEPIVKCVNEKLFGWQILAQIVTCVMKMPELNRTIVFYFAVFSFLLLLAVQFVWLNNTYKLKQKEFDETVKNTLRFFNHDFQQNDRLAANMKAVWYDSTLITKVEPLVKYAIDTCFTNKNLSTDYVFGVGKNNQGIFYASNNSYIDSLNTSKLAIRGLCRSDSGAIQIKFFFPNKEKQLLSELTPFLGLSGFSFLVLIFCFIGLVAILKKQAKLSVVKNDFINNMTHELKTPLFTISIASKMLAQEYEKLNNTKLSKYTNSIQQETKRLNTLVDNILQAALLEQKKLTLDKKTMDVHTAIKRAAQSFELIRQEKGGTIILNLDADNHYIIADETHIVNTIYNLLDNAFKYTDKKPEIFISTRNKGNDIVLSIKDNGIGLDAETKELVFERFFRAHTGNLHNVKGYGIGLSYAKSVVEAHNGFLTVSSQMNKGSEFTLQIPHD